MADLHIFCHSGKSAAGTGMAGIVFNKHNCFSVLSRSARGFWTLCQYSGQQAKVFLQLVRLKAMLGITIKMHLTAIRRIVQAI
jgi:hypothetical protein